MKVKLKFQCCWKSYITTAEKKYFIEGHYYAQIMAEIDKSYAYNPFKISSINSPWKILWCLLYFAVWMAQDNGLLAYQQTHTCTVLKCDHDMFSYMNTWVLVGVYGLDTPDGTVILAHTWYDTDAGAQLVLHMSLQIHTTYFNGVLIPRMWCRKRLLKSKKPLLHQLVLKWPRLGVVKEREDIAQIVMHICVNCLN